MSYLVNLIPSYDIMRQCWEDAGARPTIAHLHSLLAHLHSAGASGQDAAMIGDFEHRWNQLQHRDSRDHSIRLGSGTGADLRYAVECGGVDVGVECLRNMAF